MTIGGLQKLTLIDYPGKLACTLFLTGCNFRCPWCYASHLVLPEEIKKQLYPVKQFRLRRNSSSAGFNGVNPVKQFRLRRNSSSAGFNGAEISEKDFFKFLKERRGLLEAVTICGGEPCINKDLPTFCQKLKKLGYLVKLDTNGSNPEMLKKLIDKKLIDYVAMDIKAPLEPKSQISNLKSQIYKSKIKNEYNKATGTRIDLRKIRTSVEIIKNSGIDYEFRTTVTPGIHTKEDILQIAKDISPAKRYFLQNFRPEKTIDPKFEKIKPYPQEFLLEIQKTIAPFFEICQVR